MRGRTTPGALIRVMNLCAAEVVPDAQPSWWIGGPAAVRWTGQGRLVALYFTVTLLTLLLLGRYVVGPTTPPE